MPQQFQLPIQFAFEAEILQQAGRDRGLEYGDACGYHVLPHPARIALPSMQPGRRRPEHET